VTIRRRLIVLASALAVATACGAPSAQAGLRHPTVPGRLSDEVTLTRWTTAFSTERVRTRPTRAARTIARLRFETENGLPEVYVALEQVHDAAGRTWVRVRLPTRARRKTGWVAREALGVLHRRTGHLVVDQSERRATLHRGGRVVWSSRIGIGKPGTPTPRGHFYIREKLHNLRGNPIYGPIAFGTSAYSRLSDWPAGGVIGIHGTDQPSLLPGRVSHGCVRVPNAAIGRLARRLSVGTPVDIRP
jgi:hypothetical protein